MLGKNFFGQGLELRERALHILVMILNNVIREEVKGPVLCAHGAGSRGGWTLQCVDDFALIGQRLEAGVRE